MCMGGGGGGGRWRARGLEIFCCNCAVPATKCDLMMRH